MANTPSGTASQSSSGTNGRHASISDIKGDVQTLKRDLTDMASGVASEGRAAVQHGYERASERAHDMMNKGKEEVERAHDSLAEYVSKRPITSLAIAFGVGAVLARLMRR